jgi:hypothetical protein
VNGSIEQKPPTLCHEEPFAPQFSNCDLGLRISDFWI